MDEKLAYKCWVIWSEKQAGRLYKQHTARLRTDCATVDDAVQRLQKGETVVVFGSDMGQLKTHLAGLGVLDSGGQIDMSKVSREGV